VPNLDRRHRKTDGVTSVLVRWKDGGSRAGAWQCETFAAGSTEENETAAADFKATVEAAGHGWPDGRHRREAYRR
jgi:hypothetical protein